MRDTIFICQERQNWYREYANINELPKLDFIGSTNEDMDPITIAHQIKEYIDFPLDRQLQLSTFQDIIKDLIEKIEYCGIMVMASSIVGNNNRRKLNINEFRGFTLADNVAPIIFLNASDSKSAQIFTLIHELAHLWLGSSNINNNLSDRHANYIETWCNKVAAEFLIPLNEIKKIFKYHFDLNDEIKRLSKLFKVSKVVVIIRHYHVDLISKNEFSVYYENEYNNFYLNSSKKQGGGGNFYNTLKTRVSKRFAQAVLSSAVNGQTLIRDASNLLGVKSNKSFYEAAREFGVL